MDKIRSIRMIVLEGERDWVEKTLEKSIQGTVVVDPEAGNKIHTYLLKTEVMGEGE